MPSIRATKSGFSETHALSPKAFPKLSARASTQRVHSFSIRDDGVASKWPSVGMPYGEHAVRTDVGIKSDRDSRNSYRCDDFGGRRLLHLQQNELCAKVVSMHESTLLRKKIHYYFNFFRRQHIINEKLILLILFSELQYIIFFYFKFM